MIESFGRETIRHLSQRRHRYGYLSPNVQFSLTMLNVPHREVTAAAKEGDLSRGEHVALRRCGKTFYQVEV